ncbi:MAG: translation elongation factor Ts [Treponema sp.]|jgi:elongation factor Ts|nr:translation elongation factor Ts [Treponema sp.]
MAVTVADIKKLREKTGAGPMECKKALEEANGDFAAAEKHLKEKGLAAVEKRSYRATNEGKIFIKAKDKRAVVVELASETDFVARNPEFIALGDVIADRALEKGYTAPNEELSAVVTDLAAKIRENMSLKRLKLITAGETEYLASYIHGDGAIGIIVKLSADKVIAQTNLESFAYSIAMHIAAFSPLVLSKDKLDPSFIKEQEDIFRKQMEADESLKSKPVQALESILRGKLNKFLKSICLLDQGYIKDEKITVAQALADTGKQLGASLAIVDYVYFKVGQE